MVALRNAAPYLLLVLAAVATAGTAAARSPQASPYLQQDWNALRTRCEAGEGSSCAAGAERENCVRR